MNIKPVRNAKTYRAALSEIESLMDARAGTPEGDKLDVLVTLVQAYEAKAFPTELPDPIEAIRFEMERKGLAPKDLEPMIGQRNRVYEILNRTRPLTLPMIRRLHEGLGVPVECLVGQ